jgi:GxxExxY protein
MYSDEKIRSRKLLHPKLSYDVVGVLLKVYKSLGAGLPEKYYQKAVAEELKEQGFSFQEQVRIQLMYNSKIIGTFYADFVINNLMVLELKTDRFFSRKNIEQLNGYLKGLNLELGILANFTRNGLEYKRILNLPEPSVSS